MMSMEHGTRMIRRDFRNNAQCLRFKHAHNLSSPFLSGQKGLKKPPACPHATAFSGIWSRTLL